MKLASVLLDGIPAYGCIEADLFLDFTAYGPLGATLRTILPAGLATWQALAGRVAPIHQHRLDLTQLLAPIPEPRKFLALGGNYASHAAEAERAGIVRPAGQIWFNKQVSCINAPYGPIVRPAISYQMDYEGELGVIIARDCRHVHPQDAWDVIAGYVVCNDLSVRDWQMRAPTHTLGKSFDTHGPFGPWIVTADEVPDVHALRLQTSVNGEVRQDANTRDMVHKIPALIAELSTAFTLQAGDVLATGTPAGVGGLFDPPRYLSAGDVVRVEIESIGYIENRVIDEPRSGPSDWQTRPLDGPHGRVRAIAK